MKPTDVLNGKALRYLEKQLGKVRFGFSMARKKAGVSSRELDNLRGKEEVLNWLVQVVKGLGNRPPVAEWISVEDRLPERHGQLCVGLYSFSEERGYLTPYVFAWHAYGDNGYVDGPHFSDEGLDGLKVHYWMPLPEPPKEDVADENA